MKYSEFERLNSILENKGITVGSFIKTTTQEKPLFEADNAEELDTKVGNVLTRSGRARMKLNANAKKVQAQVMDNLYKKYYVSVLNDKKNILDQIIKLKEDNKSFDEIKNSLMGNIKTAGNAQSSQLNVLDKAADKILMNYTKKIDAIIQQSKMNDNNKLSLSNYWIMLTSQIKLNLYKYIQKQELSFIKRTLGNEFDETEESEIESLLNDVAVQNRIKTAEANVSANKETVKHDIAAETEETAPEETEETEETAPEETEETTVPAGETEEMKPTEEPAKEEPAKEEPTKEEPAKEEPAKEEPAKEEPAKEEPAKEELPDNLTLGKIYQLQNGNEEHEAKILGINKGNVVFSLDGTDKKQQMPIDKAAVRFGDEIIPTEAEEVGYTDAENQPIKVGDMYAFTDKNGNSVTATISKIENGYIYYKTTADDKEHKMSKLLGSEKLEPKSIGEGKPRKATKAKPMGSGEASSTGITHVMPERSSTGETTDAKEKLKAQKLADRQAKIDNARKTKPGRGTKKVITKK